MSEDNQKQVEENIRDLNSVETRQQETQNVADEASEQSVIEADGEVINTPKQSTAKQIALIGLFVALMAVSSWLRIPLVIPVTLQLAVVALAAMVLTPGQAFAAMATYVVLGLVGLPVFASGGGLGYVVSPTFGYLIGFVLGAPLGAKYLRRKPLEGHSDQAPARGLFKNVEVGENPDSTTPTFGQYFIAGISVLMVTYACGIWYSYWLLSRAGGSAGLASVASLTLGLLYMKDVVCVVLAAGIAKKLYPFTRLSLN